MGGEDLKSEWRLALLFLATRGGKKESPRTRERIQGGERGGGARGPPRGREASRGGGRGRKEGRKGVYMACVRGYLNP